MSDKRPSFVEQKMGECVHFTGIQHGTCGAGIPYAAVRDESTRPFGFPCLSAYAGNAVCAARVLKTREQAEAEDAAFEAAFTRINTCLKAIREKHGKARGLAGEMPCPIRCGGTLHYSIAAYNGHIHGQCSTADCAKWMQ